MTDRDHLPLSERNQKIHIDLPMKKVADQKPRGLAAKKKSSRKASGRARAKNRGNK